MPAENNYQYYIGVCKRINYYTCFLSCLPNESRQYLAEHNNIVTTIFQDMHKRTQTIDVDIDIDICWAFFQKDKYQ